MLKDASYKVFDTEKVQPGQLIYVEEKGDGGYYDEDRTVKGHGFILNVAPDGIGVDVIVCMGTSTHTEMRVYTISAKEIEEGRVELRLAVLAEESAPSIHDYSSHQLMQAMVKRVGGGGDKVVYNRITDMLRRYLNLD